MLVYVCVRTYCEGEGEGVFERRTSHVVPSNIPWYRQICIAKCIIEMICSKMLAKPLLMNAKSPFPADLRRCKTSLLRGPKFETGSFK